MKLLLTSSGISNASIHNALVGLLGKPIADCNALFVLTGIYPFPFGARYAWNPISGKGKYPFCNLGWKTTGLLELSALPSIDRDVWMQAIDEADALLIWGGDPLYISYWLEQSGLTALLPALLQKMVYVGVSAGSIAMSRTFAESYTNPRRCAGTPISSAPIVFSTPKGEFTNTLVIANGAGLIDFAIIPHLDAEGHDDASMLNAEKWAATLTIPVYAIDDQTAIQVVDSEIEVISEGNWKLFNG